jgi:RNA recognition motif-containing protein
MGKRIYCGNLSFRATEADVRDLFSQHGEVTDVHLVMDRETGRSRGFAFVEMATDEQAKAAVSALDGYRLQDRNLKVNEAQPREAGGGGGGRGGGGGGYGGGGGGRGGGGGGYGGGGGGGGYGGGGRDRY